jgi:hypothetical protein
MTVASAILYRPLLWFLVPGAMFAAWKGSYWAFDYFGRTSDWLLGIGWACMVLWFPALLACIVLADGEGRRDLGHGHRHRRRGRPGCVLSRRTVFRGGLARAGGALGAVVAVVFLAAKTTVASRAAYLTATLST